MSRDAWSLAPDEYADHLLPPMTTFPKPPFWMPHWHQVNE
jgi:hypothetical protein